MDLLATQYDTGVRRLDFSADPERARTIINDWVADTTHGTVVDLLPSDVVTRDTALVLVNALYFYGSWLEPFTHGTATGNFTDLLGSVAQVPMMFGRRNVAYAETAELTVAELPYVDGKLRMTIVVPKVGKFQSVRSKASAQWLDELTAQLSNRPVDVQLPKFRFTPESFKLKRGLEALGMKTAFNGDADFTGITPGNLLISDVLQRAFISVDEEGTEAAAATAVIFAGTSAPAPATPFNVDKPFLFFIRDEHGTILFSGHVVDPAQAK